MKIDELITRHVVTALEDEPLVEAIGRMRAEHVGALVILSGNATAEPIGILTDRDIVVGVFANAVDHVSMLTVGDVMSERPVTASEDEDVIDVLRRMRSFGVRRVPVVDAEHGQLVGILSLDDVVAGLSEELAEAAALVARQSEREADRRP